MPSPLPVRKWERNLPDQTLYHILVVGQSNATGTYTNQSFTPKAVSVIPVPHCWVLVPISTAASTSGFRGGINPLAGNSGNVDPAFVALTPIVEQDTDTTHGESVGYGMLSQLQRLTGKRFSVSCCGIDGTRYSTLAQGQVPYNNGKSQVTAAQVQAKARGWPFKVAAVVCIHGEADQSFLNTSYAANLATWQANYQTDLQAITGQTDAIPFFACPQAAYGALSFSATTDNQSSTYNLWQAALANPTKIYLTNPRYVYNHSDALHLSPHAYRWHGQQIAKVINQVVFQRQTWLGLTPNTAVYDGSVTITVTTFCPVSPLVIDRTLVLTAGAGCGFTFTDDSGSPPTVTNCTVSSTTITLTLSGASTGTAGSRKVRYAWGPSVNSTPFGGFSETSGPRGNIRDSDPFNGIDGYPMYNWLVPFTLATG